MAKASDFEGKKQDELFYFVDYSPEEAERVGYSNYSYWGSVVQNFLKHKAAVVCLILFLFLVIFSFIALAIGKYDIRPWCRIPLWPSRSPTVNTGSAPTTSAATTGVRCGTPLRCPSVWPHRCRGREHPRRHHRPDLGLCP